MADNQKQIVFIEAGPTYTPAKMAYALRKKGYKTILISLVSEIDHGFLKDSYDEVISFDFKFFKISLMNLPKIVAYGLKKVCPITRSWLRIRKLNPYMVIALANPNWLCFLSRKYFKNSPFIFFPYDIRTFGFEDVREALSSGVPRFEVAAEKYCFRNSDGIMHKGEENELDILSDNLLEKVDITAPVLHIPIYTLQALFVPINKNKLSKKDKEIHIVFVGGLGTDSDWFDSIKKVLDEKIHLHLYPKWANLTEKEDSERIKGYEIFEGNKYFHLEKRTNQKELAREISKYDYGTWLVYYKKTTKFISKGVGNKLATYLESGLPIIYFRNYEYIGKILSKYGAGIGIDWKDSLRKVLNRQNYQKLIKNTEKARNSISIGQDLNRVEEFFSRVLAYHNKEK